MGVPGHFTKNDIGKNNGAEGDGIRGYDAFHSATTVTNLKTFFVFSFIIWKGNKVGRYKRSGMK